MTRKDDFNSSNYIRTMSNILFPSIMIIGVAGNIMVMMVIFKTKEMRNSTNIFLVNLAIADLINLLVMGTMSFIDLFSPGILDICVEVCKIVPMLAEVLTYASVLTVFAIGYERYYAICQPLKAGYICTKRRAIRTCLLAWPIAVLFSVPYLSIMVYQKGNNITNTLQNLTETQKESCQVRHDTFWIKSYVIAISLLFYILPLIILTAIFLTIARHLQKASLAPNVNVTVIKHRRQVMTMLATVVVCFFLFLLPFRGFTLFLIHLPQGSDMWLGTQVYYNWLLFGRAMIYIHSAVNPIVYNLMSKRFRAGFKRLCCGFGWQRIVGRGWQRSERLGRESSNTTSTEMARVNR